LDNISTGELIHIDNASTGRPIGIYNASYKKIFEIDHNGKTFANSYQLDTTATGFSPNTSGLIYYSASATTINGTIINPSQKLTAASLTMVSTGEIRNSISKFEWTNDMIVSLGANTTGSLTVCTLPPKTAIKNAIIVITGSATNITTLNGEIKAINNQLLRDDIDFKQGANYNSFSDYPTYIDYVNSTLVTLNLTCSDNLEQVLTSSGVIYLETYTLP
jgi:hypothetical protein